MTPCPATLGVILAGGLARRMGGGDKALLELQGQTLLRLIEQRLAPQCSSVILNANGDLSRFAGLDVRVAPDTIPGHPGPLAGVLAALEWTAMHEPGVEWVLTVPGDTPFIPMDLCARLHSARRNARTPLACAASAQNEHYAIGLWSIHLRHDLRNALTIRGQRRMEEWMREHGLVQAFWPTEPFDPFFNINRPEDLSAARALVEQFPALR